MRCGAIKKGRQRSPLALIAVALAIVTLATGCARETTYSIDSNLITWEVTDNHLFIKASGTLYRSWGESFGWENNDLHYRTACIAGEDLSCISDEAFQRLQSDHIQVLAPTCERIGNCCFQGTSARCVDLSRTKIASLGHHSFANTPNLEEIHLPNTVKTIDVGAFKSSALRTIYWYGTRAEWQCVEIKAEIDALETVQVVCMEDEMTFEDFSGNAWWRITGDTLEIVANGAYVGGSGSSNYAWRYGRDSVAKIIVTGSTSYLSPYAFAQRDLKEVTILSSVFDECGIGLFAGSTIGRIDLGNTSLTVLPMDIFYDSNINELVLPSSLNQIETGAFKDAEIETIIFMGSTSAWESIGIDIENVVCLGDH